MDVKGLWFDEVADRYDRVRPRYPARLFDDIAEAAAPPGARVLEVGCGPGQATRDLLARGWSVHAIEPGQAMASHARKNFAGADFTVDIARFDDWDPAGRRFDLLFSATAFHWVAPELRWTKAAEVLEPGGTIALATNQPIAGGTFNAMFEAARDLHARYAEEVYTGPSPTAAEFIASLEADQTDIGTVWHAAEKKAGPSRADGVFAMPVVRWYEWEKSYTATEAHALLSTFSQYLNVAADRRKPLLAGIEDLIRERLGGHVEIRYLTVLAMARRRE